MRHSLRLRAVAALLGAVLILPAGAVRGQDPSDAEVRRKVDDEKARLVERALRENSVIRALNELNDRISGYGRDLDGLTRQQADLARVIADTQRDVQRTALEMIGARRRAGKRLAGLYKMHRGFAVAYLLSAESPMEFARRYHSALFVARDDVRAIDEYRDRLGRLKEKLAALVARQTEIHLVAGRVRGKRADADLARREHRAVFAEIQHNERLFRIQTAELEQSSGRLQEQIDGLRAGSGRGSGKPLDFAGLKGYLDLPVPGPVIGTFGRKVNERFKTITFNRGLDIQAPEGTPIRVVFDGTVQMVQDFVGYGRIVIVDHGNRYHTLYANVDRPEVAQGAKVRRGQVLGVVGRAATSDEPSLHFEVRYQGKAVDPAAWLFNRR